jgi:Type I restriction-modification system methyltransferase subunit
MVEPPRKKVTINTLLKRVDKIRLTVNEKLNIERKEELGQFFTDSLTSKLMASMFKKKQDTVRILDPGAGIGCLSAALVIELCKRESPPKEIVVTAYEKDAFLIQYLQQTLDLCSQVCMQHNIFFSSNIVTGDFTEISVEFLKGIDEDIPRYNYVIMNPPYRKIKSSSRVRRSIRSIGIEETNLYSAFLLLASRLLDVGGEMVAITPRSFCNGPYFKNFRYEFLSNMCFKRIHTFDSRTAVFSLDRVVQENIILYAVKEKFENNSMVDISTSTGKDNKIRLLNTVTYNQFIHPKDPDLFIRLVKNEIDQSYVEKMKRLSNSLEDLGISVSTGKVVDFRAISFTMKNWVDGTVPLIYPCHFSNGGILWPNTISGKPNAVKQCKQTLGILVPRGVYVLVKRFSTKEERKRIVSSVYDPDKYNFAYVGFENHLNFYHVDGKGLPLNIAKGLSIFLNSTLVDNYFRQFNGHTQVNVADLKDINYPSLNQLESLGEHSENIFQLDKEYLLQSAIDLLIDELIFDDKDKEVGTEALAI